MPSIAYTAEFFPRWTGRKLSGRRAEHFTWPELVHAAVTVGRQNWADVLRNGNYSVLELLWRMAMLRANLRTDDGRFAPSAGYRGLDRSEKGAVSFFLGLCTAKVFAERLFGVPWLLHLDVYRAQLNPTFATQERPDFVGMDPSNRWIVLEAKGRTGTAPTSLLAKAKDQTRSLSTVAGRDPVLRVAVAAYFSSGFLRARVRDPEGARDDAKPLPINPEGLAHAYYSQFFDFARTMVAFEPDASVVDACVSGIPLPGLDATLRTSENLARWYLLRDLPWERVQLSSPESPREAPLARFQRLVDMPEIERRRALTEIERQERLESSKPDPREYTGGDQVSVHLGDSWSEELMQREPKDRAR